MSSSLGSFDSETRNEHAYSRKEKSLAVLCANFINIYNRAGIEWFGLDEAAEKLGIGRRRIYDIVNIMESVGVVSRKAKNQYYWRGFEAIPRTLEQIKDLGMRNNFNTYYCDPANVCTDNEDGESLSQKSEGNSYASSKVPVQKREKSLCLLGQNFIKLFICSDVDLICLDDAATALLGDDHTRAALRTKTRRMYDIANVFTAMDLIERTYHPVTRKPAFRWFGVDGKTKTGSASALNCNQPKKRLFGTDITNHSLKRSKVDSLSDGKLNQKMNMAIHNDRNKAKNTSTSFVFGPFHPSSLPKAGSSENKSVGKVQDWESMAPTLCTQYQNEALNDLFAHYVEVWKSWYLEVNQKKQIRQAS